MKMRRRRRSEGEIQHKETLFNQKTKAQEGRTPNCIPVIGPNILSLAPSYIIFATQVPPSNQIWPDSRRDTPAPIGRALGSTLFALAHRRDRKSTRLNS